MLKASKINYFKMTTFNRTKIECKSHIVKYDKEQQNSFNRTKIECKISRWISGLEKLGYL